MARAVRAVVPAAVRAIAARARLARRAGAIDELATYWAGIPDVVLRSHVHLQPVQRPERKGWNLANAVPHLGGGNDCCAGPEIVKPTARWAS